MNDMPKSCRSEEDSGGCEGKAAFTTTLWGVVLDANNENAATAKQALEKLCGIYWYPLYAFIRRRGSSPLDAEDLTQAFFSHLFESGALQTVSRAKGKFRSFLLAALTNFLNDEHRKSHAQKRGGGMVLESWDAIGAEQRYRYELVDNVTPERLFERRWAFTVVEQVLSQLREEYQRAGRLGVFEELRPVLVDGLDRTSAERAAAHLAMNDGAVKVALHRLRRRFGERLQAEVAATVASPDLVEEEIRYLFSAIPG
jgi:RNA polymerase sigma factor (sigma-70 family)